MEPSEIRDILLSVFVLGFIFSFNKWDSIEAGISNFFLTILLVGFSFLIKMIGHKYTADKYECRHKYIIWPQGLAFSLFATLLFNGKILFALSGFSAMSSSYFSRLGKKYVDLSFNEKGRIALTGPLFNIGLAVLFKMFEGLLNPEIVLDMVIINLTIAFFSLIPLPPLDGSHILSYDWTIWLMVISSTTTLLFLLRFANLLISFFVITPLVIAIFIFSQKYT